MNIGQSRRPERGLSKTDLLVLLTVAMLAVFFGVRTVIRSSVVRPFAGHLNEYLDIPGLKSASTGINDDDFGGNATLSFRRQEGYGRPCVAGKVIPVDKAASKIDNLYFSLPTNFRAAAPEEVGTVVWLNWKEESAGMYTDGSTAYKIACEVTVIDKERALIVDQKTFYGSSPPSIKRRGGSRTGSKPTDEVVQYLTNFPSRSQVLEAGRNHNPSARLVAKAQPQGRSVGKPSVPRSAAIPPSPPQETSPELTRPAPRLPVLPQAPSPEPRSRATVELTGVFGLFGKAKALLEIREPNFRTPKQVIVEAGDRVESIEVKQIDVAGGQVRIQISGVEQCLFLKASKSAAVAAKAPAGSP